MDYNEFECPNCEEIVEVPVPYAKYVDCPGCKLTLEIHPDADQDENGWHDRTTLSLAKDQNDSTAILEAARVFDGEDAEAWQRRSDEA